MTATVDRPTTTTPPASDGGRAWRWAGLIVAIVSVLVAIFGLVLPHLNFSSYPHPVHGFRTVAVENQVTSGATQMSEDTTPAYLSTRPIDRCAHNGCKVPGSHFVSNDKLSGVVCRTTGQQTTNGDNTTAVDDHNPGLFTSNVWLGVRMSDKTLAYINVVWVVGHDQAAAGLSTCS